MTAKDHAEGVIEKTASLLERTTETKLFLHLLCILLHLDLAISIGAEKRLLTLTWADIESLRPGLFVSIAGTYCLAMGLIFKMLYAIFSFVGFQMLPSWLLPKGPSTLDPGIVSLFQAWEYAHKSKDYEVVKMFDAHRDSLARERAAISELAQLSFSAFVLGLLDRVIVKHGLLADAETLFRAFLPGDSAYALGLLVAGVLMYFVWIDVTDRVSSEKYYMYYPPLYTEHQARRDEEREKRDAMMRQFESQRSALRRQSWTEPSLLSWTSIRSR